MLFIRFWMCCGHCGPRNSNCLQLGNGRCRFGTNSWTHLSQIGPSNHLFCYVCVLSTVKPAAWPWHCGKQPEWVFPTVPAIKNPPRNHHRPGTDPRLLARHQNYFSEPLAQPWQCRIDSPKAPASGVAGTNPPSFLGTRVSNLESRCPHKTQVKYNRLN